MLSKHPGRCRFPHGHSRLIELVLASDALDRNDMVVDFKWVKLAVEKYIDQFDHAMCVNAADPLLEKLAGVEQRVIVFDEGDPTTERMAERIFRHLQAQIAAGAELTDDAGLRYRVDNRIRLERVRVWETSTSWAEYAL